MSFSFNACIRLPSPPPLPNTSPPPFSSESYKIGAIPTNRLYRSSSKEAEWRRNTLAAAAVAVVTIGTATAMELPAVHAAEAGRAVAAPEAERWSEKRKCPPWHANSLENIVPENLPRPSPSRRSDGIAAYRDAPALAGDAQVHRYSRGCYSL